MGSLGGLIGRKFIGKGSGITYAVENIIHNNAIVILR
jgi:hypothetical protein